MTDDNKEQETEMAQTKEKVRPSDKLSSKQLIEKHGNKSQAIRALAAEGYSTSEIANKLGIIYQHARNVLKRPLKRQEAQKKAK